MILVDPKDRSGNHYINERALTFSENDLEDPQRIAVSLVSGTVIMVNKKDDGDGVSIPRAANGDYEKWTLKGYSTKIPEERNAAHYIFARLSRSERTALIVFSLNNYNIDGSVSTFTTNEDGSVTESRSEASSDYYYIRIGYLSETDGSSDRVLTYDCGQLSVGYEIDDIRGAWNELFVPHYDDPANPKKLTWIEAKSHMGVNGGVTMFVDNGSVDLPSLYEGLPVDGDTLYWEEDGEGNKVLKAREQDFEGTLGSLSNVGEWADTAAAADRIMVQKKGSDQWVALSLEELGTASFENVKESGEGNAYTAIELSEDKKTLTLKKGETFAKQSDYEALNTKVTDFLEGEDADTIINKWKELETFLGGMSESDELATVLSGKADKGTTLKDYGITDAYTKEEVAGELKKYVSIEGKEEITGEKDFTGGLKVNGSPIVYDAENKYWKLDGDLLVTGGMTMFVNEGKYTPSTIMDAVQYDGKTIIRDGSGNLALNPDLELGGGASSWEDLEGKPSWITDSKPEYSYSEISGTPDLSAYALKTSLDGYQTKITSSNKLDYSLVSGTPESLKNPHALSFGSKSYDGSQAMELTASDLGALTSHQTIYNLTLQAGTFSAKTFDPNGAAQTVNIPTTTSHISEGTNLYFTDARAVAALAETLKGYLPLTGGKLTGSLRITDNDGYYNGTLLFGDGEYVYLKEESDDALTLYARTGIHLKTAGGGITVDSIPVYKSQDDVLYIDGNLVVRGGITMYGDESVSASTIMDAIAVDGTTISKANGYLEVIGGAGGGVTDWEDLEGKPTTLAGYGITDAKISGGVITLGGSTITPLTSHQTIYNLTLQAGAFSAKTFDPNGAAQTVNIPTKTSHLSNDSGFATTSDLDGRIDALVNGAPAAYDTLKEIADVLAGNVDSIGDILTALSGKADKATTLAGYGITDAKISGGVITLGGSTITPLTSHQTIYNLTLQAGTFSAKTFDPNGSAQTVNIPTTTSHISEGSNLYFTNARAVAALADTLKGYLPLSGGTMTGSILSQAIYPKASNTYALGTSSNLWSNLYTKKASVDGISIYKSSTGVLRIDGDLVVSGAVTMFGTDSTASSTIMDGVVADERTITNDGGVLKIHPDVTLGGGASSWDDLTGKPTTLAGYGITDAKISGGVITLGGSTITPLTQSTGDARYVTALGTDGDYLTWTKNGTVNNITVPYASNSGLLSGYSLKNVNSRRYQEVDASALSTSNFYPVTVDSTDWMWECEIHSPNVSSSSAYNQNVLSFQWVDQGWNDTPDLFKVLHYGVYAKAEITIGCLGAGTESGGRCVWVRGGMKYRFMSNLTVTLRKEDYTSGTSVFSVGTSYSGGTNTKVSVKWTPQETTEYNVMTLGGGTLSGTLNTCSVVPAANNTYSCGSSTSRWGYVHSYILNAGQLTYASLYTSSLSTAGWYRIATSNVTSAGGGNYLFSIARFYNTNWNESYQVSASVAYSGTVSFTQLSGNHASTQLVTKMRCVYDSSGSMYFDIYYAGSSANDVKINGMGNMTLQRPMSTATDHGMANEEVFILGIGCVSDKGFTGDLEGNASTATKLAASRTIWGQSFDGSSDVSGGMTGVSTIYNTSSNGVYLHHSTTPSGLGSLGSAIMIGRSPFNYGIAVWGDTTGKGHVQVGRKDGDTTSYSLALQEFGGNVGIGTASPSYKLHVKGDSSVDGNLKMTSATIDGIKLSKSQDGVLYLDGNLVVSGGVTMYGTNATSAPSILDSLPVANTSGTKGIATFDGNFFTVTDGKVSLIADNVGLNETELASYLTTNKYLTQTSGDTRYVLKTAYTAADVLAKLKTVDGSGSGLDADTLDGNDSAWFLNNVVGFKFTAVSASVSGDCNSVTEGILHNYYGTASWKNAPAGFGYGKMLNLRATATDTLNGQLAWDVETGSTTDTTKTLWWRASDDGTWTEAKWHQIAFTDSDITGNAATATKATQDGNGNTISSTYLKLSGGTVTGSVIMDGGAAKSSLIVRRHPSVITFQNSSGTTLGYLGFGSADTPCMYTSGSVVYTLLSGSNYTGYMPLLNSSSTHATKTSVIYAPATAGTSGQVLSSSGSGAPTWVNQSTLSAGSATKATQDGDGNTISSTYLKLSGGTMTGTITSRSVIPSASNTYNLGSSSYRFKEVLSYGVSAGVYSYSTMYDASLNMAGWKRIATSLVGNGTGGNYLFCIYRSYNNTNNEAYHVSVSVSYSGKVVFTQLSGGYNTQLITKMRCVYKNSAEMYFDIYYNSTVSNHVRVNGIGLMTMQAPTATDTAHGLDNSVEFSLGEGCVSSAGFAGDLSGNASTATKLAASRTIWGQSFDGSSDVSGGMTGVSTIYNTSSNGVYLHHSTTPSGLGSLGSAIMIGRSPFNYGIAVWGDTTGKGHVQVGRKDGDTTSYSLALQEFGGNVGIGTSSPSYKLHVAGTSYTSGGLTTGGSILPETTGTTHIGKYGTSFYAVHSNLVSSGAAANNLWLIAGNATSGTTGIIFARNATGASSGEIARMTNTCFYPYTTLSMSLGASSNKWKNLYAGTVRGDATGAMWIGGMTADNAAFVNSTKSTSGSYHPILYTKTYSDNVVNLGSYVDNVGFYGYYAGRTANGTDWSTVWYSSNGLLTHSASMTVGGDLLVKGGITMYSDERKKTILKDVELSLKEVADAPLIEHYYNSDGRKTTHVGSIAQYWAGLNDWFCKKDSEGFYTMEIQNAALASAISVARELSRFESNTDKRIRLLEEENRELRKEIDKLKQG